MGSKQVGGVQLQIDKMVDMSTNHIPRKTSIALGEDANALQSAELWHQLSYTGWHDYGWIIFCSVDAAAAIHQEHPELSALIELCVKQGVAYLKLDSDAPSVEGLPVFDW